MWPVVRDCVPAGVVCPYGENSASADSKYDGSFCGPLQPAAAEPGRDSEIRIVGIALPLPAARQ